MRTIRFDCYKMPMNLNHLDYLLITRNPEHFESENDFVSRITTIREIMSGMPNFTIHNVVFIYMEPAHEELDDYLSDCMISYSCTERQSVVRKRLRKEKLL